MKLTSGASVIGGKLLRIKSDFTFVMLVSLNSNINLKLHIKLEKFIDGLNL